MIPICIYSHSDYQDVLEIQCHYLSKINKPKYLLINNFVNIPLNIFDKILNYDDSKPYAARLHVLENLNEEYVLLVHDMDILININNEILDKIVNYAKNNNIDRIDLKCCNTSDGNVIKVDSDISLVLQKNINDYIYNVNPSIWKVKTLIEIMKLFSHFNYREIENIQVQTYCKNKLIYKLIGKNKINCGYFMCMDYFQYLHITHHGQYLPNINNFLDDSPHKHYDTIYKNFILKSKRPIRKNMW